METDNVDPGVETAVAEPDTNFVDDAPVEADGFGADSPEPTGDADGILTGTVDEAREKKWVPYESRFKPLYEETKNLRSTLDEAQRDRSRLLDLLSEQKQQSEPYDPGYDEDDPHEVSRRALGEVQRLQMQIHADRKASAVRQEVVAQVTNMGFDDPGDAQNAILRDVALHVQQNNGNLPDVSSIARGYRQREIDREKVTIERWRSKKASAQKAKPNPPSPPVVSEPP